MTVINVTFPFDLVNKIEDYSRIINEILKFNISFNILKFSTGVNGLNLMIDIPKEKLGIITKSLKHNNVIINKKGYIIFISDLCIHCGSCISLCPTNALFYDRDDKVHFSETKCIGCLLCIDSCPVFAIKEL
ncbi:MAG: 4Fe-4S binding protein [Candidatus Lokiarchaeota archaeon]